MPSGFVWQYNSFLTDNGCTILVQWWSIILIFWLVQLYLKIYQFSSWEIWWMVNTGMDAQVSYAFHSERKLHPENFKNQLTNQVLIYFSFQAWHDLNLLLRFAQKITNYYSLLNLFHLQVNLIFITGDWGALQLSTVEDPRPFLISVVLEYCQKRNIFYI